MLRYTRDNLMDCSMSTENFKLNDTLLDELLAEGLDLTVSKNGVTLSGFYKSGTVTLTKTDNQWRLTARYNEQTLVDNLYDVVYANYSWWKYAAPEDYPEPDFRWLPLLKRFNLVKETTMTTTTYS